MTVIVSCQKCSNDYNESNYINMLPVGPLTISPAGTQNQEYKCPICQYLIMISINTGDKE